MVAARRFDGVLPAKVRRTRATPAQQLTRSGLTIIMVFPGRSEVGCSNVIFGTAP
jgi:hypothetical protein